MYSWLRLLFIFIKKQNEKGLTVIELLAATAIFLAVVIPLSSIYLSGFTMYDKTIKQTNLRSELDFVVADIMKNIQDASYFELTDVNNPDKDTLLSIFQNGKVGQLIPTTANASEYRDGFSTYKLKVDYADKPLSTITKTTFELSKIPQPNNQRITYNSDSYLVFGLFKLDQNDQVITIYLLIAPRADQTVYFHNQRAGFSSLKEIEETINTNNPPFEFIRVMKTQVSVSNSKG